MGGKYDKLDKVRIIIIVSVISVVVLAGAITALVFGLQSLWRGEIINDIIGPSENEYFCLTADTVTSGDVESDESYTIKYKPDRQGIWLYMQNKGKYEVYAEGDYGYGFINTSVNGQNEEQSGEYVFHDSFLISSFQYSSAAKYFEVFTQTSAFSDSDIGDAIGWVNKSFLGGVNTYKFNIKKNYFARFAEGYNDIKPYITSEKGPSFTIKTARGSNRVVAAKFSYDLSYEVNSSAHGSLGAEISVLLDYSKESAEIESNSAFDLILKMRNGATEITNFACSGEYAKTSGTSYDGAATYYDFSEYSYVSNFEGVGVKTFPEIDKMAVWSRNEVHLYRLSDLCKLHSFTFFYDVQDVSVDSGRLMVLFYGWCPAEGWDTSVAYDDRVFFSVYDVSGNSEYYLLNTYTVECYNPEYIGISGDTAIFVESNYYCRIILYNFISGEVNHIPLEAYACKDYKLDSELGVFRVYDTDNGVYTLWVNTNTLEYERIEEDHRLYPEPDGFSYVEFSGIEWGDYDIVQMRNEYHQCVAFYNRSSGAFEYIVPALDSSLEYDFEIIELDDGKLLCRTYYSLFVLDMTKADLHAY